MKQDRSERWFDLLNSDPVELTRKYGVTLLVGIAVWLNSQVRTIVREELADFRQQMFKLELRIVSLEKPNIKPTP